MQRGGFKLVSHVCGTRRKHLFSEFLLFIKSEDTTIRTHPLPKACFQPLPFPGVTDSTQKSKPGLSKLNPPLKGPKFCWETSRNLQLDGGEKKKVGRALAGAGGVCR